MLAQLPILVLAWLDGSGSIGEMRVTISSQLPVATIDSAAATLAAALSTCSDAVLVRQEITYRMVPEDGTRGDSGSDKFRMGVFFFECSDDVSQALIQVPSIKIDKLTTIEPGAGILIDVTDGDVVSFVEVVIDGPYCNPFAVPIASLLTAYRQSRV